MDPIQLREPLQSLINRIFINRNMKKIVMAGLGLVLGSMLYSQQLSQLSQYLQNEYLINPAAAGLSNYVDMNLSFRQQWVGFDNAPKTYYYSVNSIVGGTSNTPMYNPSLRTGRAQGVVKTPTVSTGKIKHAVGGNIISDEYGAFKKFSFNGSYAIHIPISKEMNIATGIGLGMTSFRFLQDRVNLLNDVDNTYSVFLGNNQKKNYFDLNMGLWLYTKNFFFGYSNAQVMRNDASFGAPTDSRLNVHHYISGGYKIQVSPELAITPNFLIKYMNPAPIAMDFNAKIEYQDFIFGGLSYRHKDALVGLIGVMFNNFKLGYSYDFTISNLRKHNSGGHEIIFGYRIKL